MTVYVQQHCFMAAVAQKPMGTLLIALQSMSEPLTGHSGLACIREIVSADQLTAQLGAHRPAVSHDGEEAPALYLEAINAFKACLQD